jgi:hypothetical protein
MILLRRSQALHSATVFDGERHCRLLYRTMIGASLESAPPP